MKSLIKVLFLVFTLLYLFNCVLAVRGSLRRDDPNKEKLLRPDVGQIWNDLFTVPRTTSCRAEQMKQRIQQEVLAEEAAKNGDEFMLNNSKFGWIKKWGYGPVAYLMDFFDPVFRDEVIAEFKSIHNATMSEDPENTPEYKDSFDFATKLATTPPEKQDGLMKELKRFDKTKDPVIFKISANSVQVYKALRKFNWFIDPGASDYAADFVTRYDINLDGRLSPRELILGAIFYNKGILGSKRCNHCFTKIARRIGALHTYLDCSETGFVSADQLWKGLPDLRRPTSQFNIFGFKNSENIRTNAVNDFVLKNHKAKEANVSRDEFVSGILLGIWDRQVSDAAILDDDSRNLKKLRWIENNMTDTAAYNYAKAVTRARLVEEERERYAKWERERKEKERNAQLKLGASH